MAKLALLSCLTATLFMTGLIWFVHVVHYPLFDRVGHDSFLRYHADHTRATGFVVILPMLVELVASVVLVLDRLEGSDPWLAWLGLALAVVSWACTFFLSVPAHQRLSIGFDPAAYQTLVSTNLIRVLSWSGHSAVLLIMTARALR